MGVGVGSTGVGVGIGEVGVGVGGTGVGGTGVCVGGTGVGIGAGLGVGFLSQPDQQKDQVGLRHTVSSPKSGLFPFIRFTATFQLKQPVSERPSPQR